MKIPWNDAAVLVLLTGSEGRMIAAEGTLRQMMNRVAARPPSEWHRFSISLPDRGAPPFGFESDKFYDLIIATSR